MCTKIKMYVALCFSFLLVGCGNTMYFYETEKISLTVEARPDSSQPVQGSLGIKQRVVLVAPKKEDGETVSAISSFNFKIIPRSWTPFNAVLVQTAFVTGDAASKLTDPEAAEVAKAITIEGSKFPSIDTYARCIFDSVKSDEDKRGTLKRIVDNESFKELSENEWEELKSDLNKCRIKERLHFTNSLRKEIQIEMNK